MTDESLEIADIMTVSLAREIGDADVVGVGLGTPLAVAAALLARAVHAPESHVLVGGAVDPDADLATCLAGPRALAGKTVGYIPHLETMHMAESQAMTLQFLRPAQVDGKGDLNTSRIGPVGHPTVRFPGGLATGDVPCLLSRVVAYLPEHSSRNLPERVDFVTGAGAGWVADGYSAAGTDAIITDAAVIRLGPRGPVLESVHPGWTPPDVRGATGFELRDTSAAGVTEGPTPDERLALEHLDPDGLRAGEITPRSGAPSRGAREKGRRP